MLNLQTLPQKYKTLPQLQNPRKITAHDFIQMKSYNDFYNEDLLNNVNYINVLFSNKLFLFYVLMFDFLHS